jgi:hypothetical protein
VPNDDNDDDTSQFTCSRQLFECRTHATTVFILHVLPNNGSVWLERVRGLLKLGFFSLTYCTLCWFPSYNPYKTHFFQAMCAMPKTCLLKSKGEPEDVFTSTLTTCQVLKDCRHVHAVLYSGISFILRTNQSLILSIGLQLSSCALFYCRLLLNSFFGLSSYHRQKTLSQ